MANGFYGLLIVLFSGFVSVNLMMTMLNEPMLLAWLNQIFVAVILVTVISYLTVRLGTRKVEKEVEGKKNV